MNQPTWNRLKPSYLLALVALVLLVMPSSSALLLDVDGTYVLTRIVDKDMKDIDLSAGARYTLKAKLHSSDSNNAKKYDLAMRVGNSMGCSLDIVDGDDSSHSNRVQISRLHSTRMMPPEEVFRVEVALGTLLPATETMELVDDTLIFRGSEGRMDWRHESS